MIIYRFKKDILDISFDISFYWPGKRDRILNRLNRKWSRINIKDKKGLIKNIYASLENFSYFTVNFANADDSLMQFYKEDVYFIDIPLEKVPHYKQSLVKLFEKKGFMKKTKKSGYFKKPSYKYWFNKHKGKKVFVACFGKNKELAAEMALNVATRVFKIEDPTINKFSLIAGGL